MFPPRRAAARRPSYTGNQKKKSIFGCVVSKTDGKRKFLIKTVCI